MSNNDNTPPSPMPSSKDTRRCSKKKCALWLFLFLAVLLGAAALFCPYYRGMRTSVQAQDMAQIQQRLTGLENSVRALDERVNALSSSATAAPATSEIPTPNTSAKSASDIARLQSDLVSFSSALSALQNEVKESGSHVQHAQQVTQSTVASAIAYIQLRSTALTNQPFTADLAALRNASPNDADFQKALGQMEPYAATGAETAGELRDDLISLEASASQAMDQSKAQNWWEKFVAELKGLVSVRRLHGGATDAFGAMETDLAKNDLAAALENIKNLPTEAQNVLSDWRGKVEARRTINEALHNLADHFNDLAKTGATP
jgi:hypothetical protein